MKKRLPPEETTAAATSEPQRVSPGSARSLLLTLLGEFVLPTRGSIWTAELLHALGGVGVAEKAARQAIARAAAAGWIESEREGRRAAWRLGDAGRHLISEGSRRLSALRGDGDAWSGEWMLLHVSLPEARRADRLRTYRALSWIGFGNPMPGVWISPHVDRAGEARRVIEEMELVNHTLAFKASSLDFGVAEAQLVAQAWDLTRVAEHYATLVDRFGAMRPRSQDDVLFAHIQLVNALQRLPYVDPGLPQRLLPAGWHGRRQIVKLAALRERWRAPAHAQWARLSVLGAA